MFKQKTCTDNIFPTYFFFTPETILIERKNVLLSSFLLSKTADGKELPRTTLSISCGCLKLFRKCCDLRASSHTYMVTDGGWCRRPSASNDALQTETPSGGLKGRNIFIKLLRHSDVFTMLTLARGCAKSNGGCPHPELRQWHALHPFITSQILPSFLFYFYFKSMFVKAGTVT